MSWISDDADDKYKNYQKASAAKAGLTPEEINAIYEQQAALARKSLPTRQAYQDALNSAAGITGQQQAEQFNMRGQTPQSGVFADALTRNLAQQAASSELSRAQLEAGQVGDFYKMGYGGALNANMQNAQTQNDIMAAQDYAHQQNVQGNKALVGSAIGAAASLAAPGIGGALAGAGKVAQTAGAGLGGYEGALNNGGQQPTMRQPRRRMPFQTEYDPYGGQ